MTTWCDVSLRVASSEWDARRIAAALSLPADPDPSGRDAIWTRSFAGRQPKGSSFEAQFGDLTEFLAGERARFSGLPEHCSVDVLVGWSPSAGEDHLFLAPGLLQHIAAVNAMIHVDTYVTEA